MALECVHCKTTITAGNVMVDSDRFVKAKAIDALEVWCKKCSGLNASRHLHNLWERRWIQNNTLHVLAGVLFDVHAGDRRKWSKDAVDHFYTLLCRAHPNLTMNPLEV